MEMEAVTASLFSAADIALFRQMMGMEGGVGGGVEAEVVVIAEEEETEEEETKEEVMGGVSANSNATDDDYDVSPVVVAEWEEEEGFELYRIMDLNGLLYTEL